MAMETQIIEKPDIICLSFLVLIIALSIFTAGCDNRLIKVNINTDEISDETLTALESKRILFGHSSVGYSIVKGIEELISTNKRFKKIRVIELQPNDVIDKPGIYHTKIRRNGFPSEKSDNFIKVLDENNVGKNIDIALFKYCYVDIEKNAKIDRILNYYSETVSKIHEEYPKIKILHVTTPLYSHKRGLKGLIKRIFRPDFNNIKRNEYNSELIKRFQDTEPLYDLATVQSTYPDGKRSSFKYKSKIYYSLANEYTYDGGHLNNAGRYYAAIELLKVLGSVSIVSDE